MCSYLLRLYLITEPQSIQDTQYEMTWLRRSRLLRSRRSHAKVDSEEEEAVSDVQLSSTCVAAIVGSGSAYILLADGSKLSVPQQFITRSGVLVELVNAAELASPVLVADRAHLHAWFRYLQLTNDERSCLSWLSLLRSLLVRACASFFVIGWSVFAELCYQRKPLLLL